MTKLNQTADELDILLAFSVEDDHGPATLGVYIENYPHLQSQLIDLAMDLQLADHDSQFDEDVDAPGLEAAWQRFSAMTEASSVELTSEQIKQIEASLVSSEMRAIGLPVSVLAAIKSGLVELESFPARWMDRIASAGGYAVELLRTYLERPPSLSRAISYKSDDKPRLGGKVSFQSLIEGSTLTKAEQAEILRED